MKLVSYAATVPNNLAYHQMLRCDLVAARPSLEAAAQADPRNPYAKNTMQLLVEWQAGLTGPFHNIACAQTRAKSAGATQSAAAPIGSA